MAPKETRSNLVAVIAPPYMDDVLTRRDIQQAARLIKSRNDTLTAILPFEWAMWRMQLALLTGNSELANQSLSKAIVARPAFSNSTEYVQFKETIFKLNSSVVIPLTMDLSPQSVPEAVDAFYRSGDNNRLCAYLKDVLRSRNESAIAVEGDVSLFIGAKPYFRQVLTKYISVYDLWLSQEIQSLGKQSSRSADAARLSRVARLSSSGELVAEPVVADSALSSTQYPYNLHAGRGASGSKQGGGIIGQNRSSSDLSKFIWIPSLGTSHLRESPWNSCWERANLRCA